MAQTIKWISGFEMGSNGALNEFAATFQSGNTIQSTTKRTGGFALKCLGSIGQTKTGLNVGTQSVLRGYMLIDGAPPGQGNVFTERNSSGNRATVQLTTSKTLFLSDASATLGITGAGAGTTVLNVAQWYRLELVIDLAAGGSIDLYLDGVLEKHCTHTTDRTASPTDGILLQGNTTNAIYFDDIRIDGGGTALIGDGKCIARQGTNNAGTAPAFTAFTKTGGTTSGDCWSDTPESAAKNCSGAAANAAQTMIVDKFSVDPSRSVEGTDTIGASDTINACQIVMVAKSSATLVGSMSIRRRVGGANTDSAAVSTLTTDSVFSSLMFTDTPANLDAYEIGVVNSATASNTRTVEDMWMMVDYTPVIAPAGFFGRPYYDLPGVSNV